MQNNIYRVSFKRTASTVTGTKGNPKKCKSSLGQAKNVFLKSNSKLKNTKYPVVMIKDSLGNSSFMGQLPI